MSIWVDKSKILDLKSIDPEVFDALASQIKMIYLLYFYLSI